MRRECFAVLLSAVPALAVPATAAPVSLQRFLAQPRSEPDVTIQYGPATEQGIDLFLPRGKGPHPVVVLIHGGCWTKETAAREQLRGPARDLANRGFAVWSIGYRRVDETGGAYPGIFQDVAKAVDLLPDHAAKHELDTARVVAVGHSAGAQLALWAASRRKLPPASPAHAPNPFAIRNVIGVGGVGDLEGASGIAGVCGPTIVPALLGPPSAARPDVYADTSPSRLLPNGATTVMITGAEDSITPPAYARTYVDQVKAAGGAAELVVVPDAGHFDVVTVDTPAWRLVVERITAALER